MDKQIDIQTETRDRMAVQLLWTNRVETNVFYISLHGNIKRCDYFELRITITQSIYL